MKTAAAAPVVKRSHLTRLHPSHTTAGALTPIFALQFGHLLNAFFAGPAGLAAAISAAVLAILYIAVAVFVSGAPALAA